MAKTSRARHPATVTAALVARLLVLSAGQQPSSNITKTVFLVAEQPRRPPLAVADGGGASSSELQIFPEDPTSAFKVLRLRQRNGKVAAFY